MSTEEEKEEKQQGTMVSFVKYWLGKPWWAYCYVCLGIISLCAGVQNFLSIHTSRMLYSYISVILELNSVPLTIFGLIAIVASAVRFMGIDIPKSKSRHYCVAATILLFLGIGILWGSLAVQGYRSAAKVAEEMETAPERVNPSLQKHLFGENKMMIEVPSFWRKTSDPNILEGILHLSDSLNDLHLTAAYLSKIDIEVSNISEVATFVSNSISSEFKNPQIEETIFSKQGHFEKAFTTIHVIFEGVKITYFVSVFDCDHGWVQLVFWTTPSQIEKHSDTFDQISHSLRFAK